MSECAHYWIIEAASGPDSKGVCEHCHKSKYFKNWISTEPSFARTIPAEERPYVPYNWSTKSLRSREDAIN